MSWAGPRAAQERGKKRKVWHQEKETSCSRTWKLEAGRGTGPGGAGGCQGDHEGGKDVLGCVQLVLRDLDILEQPRNGTKVVGRMVMCPVGKGWESWHCGKAPGSHPHPWILQGEAKGQKLAWNSH